MSKKYFCVSLFAAVLCCGAPVFSQEPGTKTLTILDAWNDNKSCPVKIVSVKLDNQKIASDKPFQASDDWLRDLRFTIRNVSQKSIKEIKLRVDAEGSTLYDICLGKAYLNFPSPKDRDELLLKPSQLVQVQFNPSRDQKRAPNFSQINKVSVYVVSAVFEDTTSAWMKGRFMRRVSPNEWRVIDIHR